MDVLSGLLGGLADIATPTNLLLLAAGVTMGMVIGVMPGLGPSAGIAILLPLTFGLEPVSAVVMLAAIYYGAMYGGTITAILINTPGEAASVASTFDGYPLAQQGKAGPALVLCAAASFVAGVVGVAGLAFLAVPFGQVSRRFGPVEFFLLLLLGLSCLIVIVGGNRLKGAISALIGLAIGTVGIDLGSGVPRFTGGSPELIAGIGFVPIAIGLFGIGELLYGISSGDHTRAYQHRSVGVRSKNFWPSRHEWREARAPTARGSVLGFLVGILPGAGATIASFMAYTVEKRVSKTPERFGKGAMPGLVGPEAANNAASAGSMVPLLALGIPGSGATAVLLAALLLYGLQPGPLLMVENPDFAWAVIASMFVGNMMLVLMNIFAIPVFASFMKVPYRIAAPIIIVLCTIGTYTVNASMWETWLMLGAGVVGYYMKLCGYSPAATVVALVLGPLAEQALRQTLIISGGSFSIFWERDAARAILIVAVVLAALLMLYARYARSRAVRTPDREDDKESVGLV